MKHIYFFGKGNAEGNAKNKDILGGKGANLAEMTNLGIPVPPGFTICTNVCNYYLKNNQYPKDFKQQINMSLKKMEQIMDRKFDDIDKPLLVSIRSGARQSMPGMMETVLNIGLTSKTIPGLINNTQNKRFVYDAYRRLITMYADVVIEKSLNQEHNENNGIRYILEQQLEILKNKKNVKNDFDLEANDLRDLCFEYKSIIKSELGQIFPDDAYIQLWGGINAVFKSWNGKRAINYRNIEKIPHKWGTAVNIQAMVFGNMGNDCATGVAFTRNPSTGENKFYGEWLPNAQGEDVVAGIRTPNPLNENSRVFKDNKLSTLELAMPKIYSELNIIQHKLETHYKDMQDIEFTIQNNKLWMLQTRVGKRNANAAIRIAIEMVNEKLINDKTALLRIQPDQLNEIMHLSLIHI